MKSARKDRRTPKASPFREAPHLRAHIAPFSPLSRSLRAFSLARMNVFVTGGAGYIGSICTEELLNARHQVTVYDNLSEGHRSAVDPRARFILGDPEQPNN